MNLEGKLIAAAIAIVALLGAVLYVMHLRDRADLAEQQAEQQRGIAIQATAAASASEAARSEEQRRLAAQKEISDESTRLAVRAGADAVGAVRAAAGLRERAAAVAAGCDRGAGDSAASAAGPAASAPGGLLVDVLGRLGDAAGQLAAYADRARIAGQACQASYDALTPTTSPTPEGNNP